MPRMLDRTLSVLDYHWIHQSSRECSPRARTWKNAQGFDRCMSVCPRKREGNVECFSWLCTHPDRLAMRLFWFSVLAPFPRTSRGWTPSDCPSTCRSCSNQSCWWKQLCPWTLHTRRSVYSLWQHAARLVMMSIAESRKLLPRCKAYCRCRKVKFSSCHYLTQAQLPLESFDRRRDILRCNPGRSKQDCLERRKRINKTCFMKIVTSLN